MKPRISSLASISRISACPHSQAPRVPLLPACSRLRLQANANSQCIQLRSFIVTRHLRVDPNSKGREADFENSNARPAAELNQNVTQEEKDDFAQRIDEIKGKQIRTPWHRDGSETPPVARQRRAGAMTKGKLLTTPSRMLKLILPLTTQDTNTDRKDVEPLALLVHPQQPLSYLERLIQAELPTLKEGGKERIPSVYFRAEDSMQDEHEPSQPQKTPVSEESEEELEELEDSQKKGKDKLKEDEIKENEIKEDETKEDEIKEDDEDFEKVDEMRIDGKTEKTGKLSGSVTDRKTGVEAAALRRGLGEGGVESYSGLGQDAPSDMTSERKFVRWSSSTEIGDFIRDAARGQEFVVEIEGAPEDIRVGVPSFNDRTYYLRMRLRKTSKKIADMAELKKECDHLAHKSAQWVAKAGFTGLLGWWSVVYYLTFKTELGWDVMEPVTYLVGLSTLIGGYVWFLYHNREVSYRSAMNFTISRRQSKLYDQRGFDLRKWEALVEDGNALRKEIKAVANEYDVEWDELEDEKDETVSEALRKERKKQKKNGGKDNEEEDDDDIEPPKKTSKDKKKDD